MKHEGIPSGELKLMRAPEGPAMRGACGRRVVLSQGPGEV